MNAGSIADKYFQDALVKLGVIKDDNAEIVRFVSFEFMGYDKIGWFDVTLEEI